MGKRGPNPKPTELKVLEGTFRPDRAAKNPIKPEIPSSVPEPSSWLDSTAKKEWRRLAPTLHRLGLLSTSDMAAFESYCEAYSGFVQCVKAIKKHGMTHEHTNKNGSTNIVARPEVGMKQKYMQIIRAFCSEFGLSPSARVRMEMPHPGDDGKKNAKEADKFDQYLDGKKKRG
jgi:P27 family predicted phage terminase small subunit